MSTSRAGSQVSLAGIHLGCLWASLIVSQVKRKMDSAQLKLYLLKGSARAQTKANLFKSHSGYDFGHKIVVNQIIAHVDLGSLKFYGFLSYIFFIIKTQFRW